MLSMQGPRYTFKLRDDSSGVADDVGVTLTDNASAYLYGRAVARELMRSRELKTRSWDLEVYRDGEGLLFDIPFATVDPTLDHLRHELRLLVENVSGKRRALKDVMDAARATLRESQSLLARSRGRPHLICENGEVTIRGFERLQGALR